MEKISWTSHVRNEKVLQSRERGISYSRKEGRLTGLLISCTGTAF